MAFIGFLEVSAAVLCFLFFGFVLNKKTRHTLPTNWPFLGMVPGLLVILPRVYDWSVETLEAADLTFAFKGLWYTGSDFLFTADPSNIHHILSSNFVNYPKGPEFKKIFDIFGDGIFNTDYEVWKNLRKSAHTLLSHPDFERFTVSASASVARKGLLQLLGQAAEKNTVVDLQDVIQRYTFDATLTLVAGYDPNSLSLEMSRDEFGNAIEDAEEVIFYRHLKPRIFWKLQNWIGIGVEKKMRNAVDVVNRECTKYIYAKREEIRRGAHSRGDAMDLLTYYMNIDATKYDLLNPNDDKFLRDTMLTFMAAGRDTISSGLTWFFWLLSKNPGAVTKIREEISTNLTGSMGHDDAERQLDHAHLNKLMYLHGALCEALRLYPPVPFQHKSPAKPDVLPSGHGVGTNSKIVLAFYAMGRLRSVWGDDASEFRPERWISDGGRLKHVPSYKFVPFNAGPRTCLGKQVALTQMKIAAVEIIHKYDIKAIDCHKVELVPSIILRMKHGFNVLINKRCLP